MPDFISMTSPAPGHVDIELNLAPYVSAYEKAYSHKTPAHTREAAMTEFNKLANDIYERLDGMPGATHWFMAQDLATETFNAAQKKAIDASPASDMLKNSFIELIKNSMDEAVSRYYDSNKTQKPTIKLSLDIDNTSKPNQVSMQLTDSGRGFTDPEFLAKLNTENGRDAYVNASRGSIKKKHDDRPPLFGGQGRGLRILIADEDGDILERSGRVHRFEKPKISRVGIDNAVDNHGHIQGAQITITTSIKPRRALSDIANEIKDRVQAYKREQAAPSPAGSEATTVESTSSGKISPETVPTADSSPLTLGSLDMDFLDEQDDDSSRYQGDSPDPRQRKLTKGLDEDKDEDEELTSDDDSDFSPH
jgi:hypothetical protein